MENTPVQVITGLFHAISRKLPLIVDWDTAKHHHLLNSDPGACDAMEEMRDYIIAHGMYGPPRNLSF